MKQFEYKIITGIGYSDDVVVDFINMYGDDGWQVVAALPCDSSVIKLLLQREKRLVVSPGDVIKVEAEDPISVEIINVEHGNIPIIKDEEFPICGNCRYQPHTFNRLSGIMCGLGKRVFRRNDSCDGFERGVKDA